MRAQSPYIITVLPAGQVSAAPLETLSSSATGNSLTWNVNLPVGTSVTLQIRDSTGSSSHVSLSLMPARLAQLRDREDGPDRHVVVVRGRQRVGRRLGCDQRLRHPRPLDHDRRHHHGRCHLRRHHRFGHRSGRQRVRLRNVRSTDADHRSSASFSSAPAASSARPSTSATTGAAPHARYVGNALAVVAGAAAVFGIAA